MTERGGEIFVVDGMEFTERKDRRGRDGSRSWRCRDYKKYRCPASIKTLGGQVLDGKGCKDHSHNGDPILPQVRAVQSELRTRAAGTMDSTRMVLTSGLLGLSSDVLQRLPKRSSMEDNVRSKRRAKNPIDPNPQGLDFEIPEQFRAIVLYDSGSEDPSRFLILGEQDLMNKLENSDLWLGDGTFDVCPAVFYQLYTVHCQVGNSFPPCVYILMPNKSQDSYVRALTKLKEIIPAASPDRVLVDFETAPINAFGQVFDTAVIKGCLFHQGQNLNKKVAELGLKIPYQTNVEFNMAVKSLLALAFVPENDVLVLFQELGEKFQTLIDENPELERANELLTYVDLYYIRGRERPGRGRAPPKYPIDMWNHFTDPGSDIPRTTNAVEGYHNGLNSLFLSKHPTLWKLLSGLQLDMALHLKTLADADVENNPARRHKYKILTERLAAKVATYATSPDKLAYLRAVANLFSS